MDKHEHASRSPGHAGGIAGYKRPLYKHLSNLAAGGLPLQNSGGPDCSNGLERSPAEYVI